MAVAAIDGFGVANDRSVHQIHDPVFGHVAARIQIGLEASVVGQGRLRDLDGEQDIVRRGGGSTVEVGTRLEQHEIRLRFGMRVEPDGQLHLDDRGFADPQREQPIEPVHDADMRRADRAHRQHLAVDELDAVVLAEDAGAPHRLVFVRSESSTADFHGHGHASPAILAKVTADAVPESERCKHYVWPPTPVLSTQDSHRPRVPSVAGTSTTGNRATRRPSTPAARRAAAVARL